MLGDKIAAVFERAAGSSFDKKSRLLDAKLRDLAATHYNEPHGSHSYEQWCSRMNQCQFASATAKPIVIA